MMNCPAGTELTLRLGKQVSFLGSATNNPCMSLGPQLKNGLDSEKPSVTVASHQQGIQSFGGHVYSAWRELGASVRSC